jgi:ketosteroid isomerase-like protein
MSQGNVDTIRAAYERFNATEQIDPQLLTPDVELTQPEAHGEITYVGRDGVQRGVAVLTDVFDVVRAEPEKFFERDAYVVAFVRLKGTAKSSGIPVDVPFAHVFRFDGALIDRWHGYFDRAEALKAVGLEE